MIGSHADLEAARLEDVRGFFREYYAPSNASLAIVGDIDYVRKQIVAWEAAGVTMMVVGARSVEQINDLVQLV